jgi:hypothetical protein
MLKVAATVAIGATGISFYAYKQLSDGLQTRELSDKELEVLQRDVPHLSKLEKYTDGNIVIGGSYGLRMFTGRDFKVNDVDVFCRSSETYASSADRITAWIDEEEKWHDNPKGVGETLKRDEELIRSLNPTVLNHNIIVKLAKDHAKSVVTDDPLREQFDEMILGTITVLPEHDREHKLKQQYVMMDYSLCRDNAQVSDIVSNYPLNLPTRYYSCLNIRTWHYTFSDLPVCIYYDTQDKKYKFHYNAFWGKLAEWGFLNKRSMTHQNRRDKYLEKGFNII